MPGFEHPRDLVRFGDFELDPATGELKDAGSTIRLQPQPLKVLLALLRHPGELVTREELRQQVMPDTPFGDADHAINLAVTKLRAHLHDSSEKPQFIGTLPRRGYRFLAKVEMVAADHPRFEAEAPIPVPAKRRRLVAAALTLVAVVAFLLIAWLDSNHVSRQQTVVISAFTNNTGDSAFDDTLRQGLYAEFQHSSVLRPLSEERISQILRLMKQRADARLDGSLGLEICQRTASSIAIDGSVTMLGNEYVLELRAVDCRTGDLLAKEQATSDAKERVVSELHQVAAKLREALESLLPSQKKEGFGTEYVTTPSLEALRTYTLAREAMRGGRDDSVAISMLQRAVTLDPEFAMAYAQLGVLYNSLGQSARAAEMINNAYRFRQAVSAHEKLLIESHYERIVTGNLPAARKQYALAALLYPDDTAPPVDLALVNTALGDCDAAFFQLEKMRRFARANGTIYAGLTRTEICRGNLDNAKALVREAEERSVDTPHLHVESYLISFLQQNASGMQEEATYLSALPEWKSPILCLEARTAAFSGLFQQARSLVHRSADLALLADSAESAANCHADAAQWEALAGNAEQAREQAQAALQLANTRYVLGKSAVALALVGDQVSAKRLAEALAQRFPQDTCVQFDYLPVIRAALALRNSEASQGLEMLAPAATYALTPYPAYLRGQIHLANHQGAAAVEQFKSISEHPGRAANDPLSALSWLGLGRAYQMKGETAEARAAYEAFLTAWKDADPDIPSLREARSEYERIAKLGD